MGAPMTDESEPARAELLIDGVPYRPDWTQPPRPPNYRARGVMSDGVFRPCREPGSNGVPECMGRAVGGRHGCTCFRWSAEQREEAAALGGDWRSPRALKEAVQEAVRRYVVRELGFDRRGGPEPLTAEQLRERFRRQRLAVAEVMADRPAMLAVLRSTPSNFWGGRNR